ncbi:hypothetical protein ACFP81_08520 [Deinococcus lacus]|uniref:ABC transmembrane type-1 domain-containing protein n=1 Tax=Deinococcus lacus TaxID=392561 RepID=A0ABW1YCK9_9DEIO
MNTSGRDPTLLLGSALGLAALALPWVSVRANRLVLGEGVGLLGSAPAWAWALPLLWAALGAAALWGRGRWTGAALALLTLTAAAISALLGAAALELVSPQTPLARVSPGSGFWLSSAALYVAAFALTRWGSLGRWAGLLATGAFVAMPLLGWWRDLGLAQEYANVAASFWPQLGIHLGLSLTALALALVLGLPLGLAAARNQRLSGAILGTAGFLQTVPSVALFGLVLPIFAALGRGTTLGQYLAWAGGPP